MEDKQEDFDYDRYFRSYREIDNYIENYIAMSSINTKNIKEKGDNKKIITGAVTLKGNYKTRHSKEKDKSFKADYMNTSEDREEKSKIILLDDNILTGKTIQIAIDMLEESRKRSRYLRYC